MSRIRMGAVSLLLAACAVDGDADGTEQAGGAAGDTAEAAADGPGAGAGLTAVAELRDSSGAVVGQATLREAAAGGVQVVVSVAGIEPGEHGVHVHEVGRCEPPFESAGGHFNPDSAQHGLENPQGPHAGDLPNMSVDGSGTGSLTETTERFTLSAGDHSVLDADGAAVVVHAQPDDMTSDPAGDAGARVACGVLERS